MLYIEFLKWAGKQGLKSKVLQKYLNKAWVEAIKGGKVVLKTHFPKLLNKAKEYHEGFKRAGLKTVPKTKQIVEKIKTVKPGEKVIVPIGSKKPPFIFTKTPKPKGPAKIIPFPKKPPGKAEGGIASLEEGGRIGFKKGTKKTTLYISLQYEGD